MASATHQELVQTRLLLEELNMRTKRQYILRHKIYYEQGIKSRKLLAKAVQNKKSSATVHHIKDKQGISHHFNEDIANQFEQYYHSLYNIPSNPKCPSSSETRKHLIQDFLKKYGPSPISTDASCKLDAPLFEKEFKEALRDNKVGKAPGPDGFPLQYIKLLQMS